MKVGEPVVVTRQPSRIWKDNRWLWFPQISRFSTGELMVGFWMSNDERYPEGSDIGGYCISWDGGRTWGWRRLRGSPAWNRHAFEDGSLIEVSWLTVPVEPDRPEKGAGRPDPVPGRRPVDEPGRRHGLLSPPGEGRAGHHRHAG